MTKIHKLELQGAIPVNSYILESKGNCLIVDPGSQKEALRDFVAGRGMKVEAILLTHAHLDHVGAVDCFDVPVLLHEKAREILLDDTLNGFDFFGQQRMFTAQDLKLELIAEGSIIKIGDAEVAVIETPGHTGGGLSFYFGNELIVGDTLFKGAVGRWDLPSADIRQLKSSVVRILEDYPNDTKIHPGHGPSTEVGYEKATNPYYLQWRTR